MSYMRIRKDERAFLERHRIPERCVADMRNRADWASCAEFMHPVGCYVAWGFRECGYGHRLTTAKGKCLQCDSAPIGFMKGYWTEGHVYLLMSQSERMVKIGWSGDLYKRLRELISERIGSLSDWQLLRNHLCRQPAILEKELHDSLTNYRVLRRYMRHNIGREARELLSCDKRTAVRVWSQVIATRSEW